MEADDPAAREQRARERRGWPGGLVRLEELPELERLQGSPEELLGLVMQLTLAAWAMSGEPIPDYPRAQVPGRVLRRPSNR